MDDLSATVAHLIHLIVTAISMKHFDEPFAIHAANKTWAVRAFQILLLYSIIGLLYNANSYVHDYFRKCYFRFYDVAEFAPFSLIVVEILRIYEIRENVTSALLVLTLLTVTCELTSKGRLKRPLVELTVALNLLALLFVCSKTENYFALSLAATYAFAHYFSELICSAYFENVPPRGLFPYSLCFMEIFAVSTLKNV